MAYNWRLTLTHARELTSVAGWPTSYLLPLFRVYFRLVPVEGVTLAMFITQVIFIYYRGYSSQMLLHKYSSFEH